MEIVFNDAENQLLQNIKSEIDEENTRLFCNTGDVIQITGIVKNGELFNTILNSLFDLEDSDESPLGLDIHTIATQENCITESVKKELLDHIEKCKELISGDKSSKLKELGGALPGLLGMIPNTMSSDIQIPDSEVTTNE